jgi:hypothetical protein
MYSPDIQPRKATIRARRERKVGTFGGLSCELILLAESLDFYRFVLFFNEVKEI